MVHYEEEDFLPVPRAKLWEFLTLHGQDDDILKIHPDIVAQTKVGDVDGGYTVQRTIKFLRGRLVTSTWKITFHPPDSYGWEILDGDGPWAPGTHLTVRYEEAPGGTRLKVEGELTVVGIPGFLQKLVVRSALKRVGEQDNAFLHGHP
jgi:Polyketide cyclase / dehydrase and lipid transport